MRKNHSADAPKNTSRRHNRSHNHATVNQDKAQHPPKWMDRGDGVLVRKNSGRHPGDANTKIKLTPRGWKSFSNRSDASFVSNNIVANAAE